MQSLRTLQWRRILQPVIIPLRQDMFEKYNCSEEWQDLQIVLRNDWERRLRGSQVQYEDICWVIQSHSFFARFFSYTQGYLYLLIPLQHVYCHKYLALHSFMMLVGSTSCYSPVGVELGYRVHREHTVKWIQRRVETMVPHHKMRILHLCKATAFVDNVCLRMLFIIFGQMFTFDALLLVWDFVLPDITSTQIRLLTFAAVILADYVSTNDINPNIHPNDYCNDIWSVHVLPYNKDKAACFIAMSANAV